MSSSSNAVLPNAWSTPNPNPVRRREIPRIVKEAQTTIAYAIASTLCDKGVCCQSRLELYSRFHKAFHGPDAQDEQQQKKSTIDVGDDGAGDDATGDDDKGKDHDEGKAKDVPAKSKEDDPTSSTIKPMVDMFLAGEGPFSPLVYPLTEGSLQVCNVFTRRAGAIVLGDSITRSKLVSIKLGKLIVGRTLYEQYERAHQNCQRATRIWAEFKATSKQQQQQHNTAKKTSAYDHFDEEFICYLLDRMHEENELEKKRLAILDQRGNNTTTNVETGKLEAEAKTQNTTKKRDSHWFFNGFWVFMLYGPMAPPEFRSQLMKKNVFTLLASKKDRDEHLSLTIEMQNAELIQQQGVLATQPRPKKSSPGDLFKEEMLNPDRVELIRVAQQQEDSTLRNEESQFTALSRQMTSLEEELKATIDIAKLLGFNSNGQPNPDHDSWKQVKEVQGQLKQKRKEVDDSTQRKRQRVEDPTSAESLTKAYIKSMTNGGRKVDVNSDGTVTV